VTAEIISKTRTFIGKKTGKIVVVGILLVVIVGVFLLLNGFKILGASGKNAVTQRTAKVARGDLTVTVTGSGAIESSNKDELFSSVNSTVTKAYFKEGDRVKAGDLMFELDDSDANLNLEQAKNNMEQALLSYNNAVSDVENLNVKAPFSGHVTGIQVKVGDVLNKGTAILTLTDNSTLTLLVPFNSGGITNIVTGQPATVYLPSLMQSVSGKVSYISNKPYSTSSGGQLYNVEITIENPGSLQEGMTANAEIATPAGTISSAGSSTLKVAESRVIKSATSGTVKKINVMENQYVDKGAIMVELEDDSVLLNKETASIKITDLQVQVDTAKKQLTYYKIYAPMDGVIVDQKVGTGDSVEKGQSLAVLIDSDHMQFPIPVDELDIAKIKLGQKVNVTIDALPETTSKPLTGVVSYIESQGTSSNGVTTYPVTISIDNPENLKVGMNANAEIMVENKTNVLYVPIEAVQKQNNKTIVWVKSDGKSGGGQKAQSQNNPTTGSNTAKAGTNNASGANSFSRQGGGNATGANQTGSSGQRSNNARTGTASGRNYANAVPREVEVGINTTDYIEIVSGLKEGEEVILPAQTQTTRSTSTQRQTMMMGGGPGDGGPR
jgi:HlyD family secretion protein